MNYLMFRKCRKKKRLKNKVLQKKMEEAAKALDFIEAARLRDVIKDLKK